MFSYIIFYRIKIKCVFSLGLPDIEKLFYIEDPHIAAMSIHEVEMFR